MSIWYGTARTNFVRVKDVEAAIADLQPFGNKIHRHPAEKDAIMISGDDDSGDFSTTGYDSNEEDIELDWGDWSEKHLKEGQILVMHSAGADKLRFVSAWGSAFNHKGEWVNLSLSEALDKAIAEKFGEQAFAQPRYEDVV